MELIRSPFHFFLGIWNNFITSGITYESDNPFKQKYYVVKFINIINLLIFFGTIPSLFVDLSVHSLTSFSTILHASFIILALITIIALRVTKNIHLAAFFFTVLLYGQGAYLIYVDTIGDNVMTVLYIIPIVLFWIQGAKRGLLAVVVLQILTFIMLITVKRDLYALLSQDFRLLYIISAAIPELIMIFFYQYVNESYSRLAEANKEELIQTVDSLEKKKLQIETTLQSVADGVFATNDKGIITSMNIVAEQLSGYIFNNEKGRHYSEIFKFQKEDAITSPYILLIDAVMAEGKTKSLTENTVLVRKDGTRVPVVVSASPISDTRGMIIGCVTALHDTTQEQELMRSKIVFVNVAAHKLRTPLGIIRGIVEGLLGGLNGPISQPVTAAVERLQQVSLRMLNLVNELLIVLQIDQKRLQNNIEPTNILNIIYEVVTDIGEKTKKKSITLTVQDLTNNLPTLMLDPSHFHEVMMKILTNAIEYNYKNGTVHIKLEQQHSYLLIHIIDTGIGIPQKNQNKIFTKFYRSEQAFLNQTEGSGLGLFISKAYIESWGGKLSFKSPLYISKTADGKDIAYGTEFIIHLPIGTNKT